MRTNKLPNLAYYSQKTEEKKFNTNSLKTSIWRDVLEILFRVISVAIIIKLTISRSAQIHSTKNMVSFTRIVTQNAAYVTIHLSAHMVHMAKMNESPNRSRRSAHISPQRCVNFKFVYVSENF